MADYVEEVVKTQFEQSKKEKSPIGQKATASFANYKFEESNTPAIIETVTGIKPVQN